MSVRLHPAMIRTLDAMAKAENRTRANMIEELLKRGVKIALEEQQK